MKIVIDFVVTVAAAIESDSTTNLIAIASYCCSDGCSRYWTGRGISIGMIDLRRLT